MALGTGFFVGIKSAGPSMSATALEYFKTNNLMDIRVQSSIGLTDKDIETIKNVEGVSGVMGQKFVDALVLVNGQPEIDIDGSQISTRAYSINLTKLQEYYYGGDDDNFINRPTLIEGTYPTEPNQCLVDASELSTPDSYKIGNVIKLDTDSKTDLSNMTVTEFQIVGIIRSPQYLSFERGNSLVGSGKIGTYIYVPESAFSSDYYSEIYITVTGAENLTPYSDQYTDHVEKIQKAIEDASGPNVEARRNELKSTLPDEIAKAEKEYNNAKESAEKELKNAEEQITTLQKYVDDPNGSYNEAFNQAATLLGVAENEFNGNTQQYNEAVVMYNNNLAAYQEASLQQKERSKQLETAKETYRSAESMLTTAQTAVNSAQQIVTSTTDIINTTSNILTTLENSQNGNLDNSQISQVLSTLQNLNPDLYAAISSLSAMGMATEAIALINPYLDEQKTKLALYENQLKEKQAELDQYKEDFSQAAVVLDAAKIAYEKADSQLTQAYNDLSELNSKIMGSQTELTKAEIELKLNQKDAINNLDELKQLIQNAPEYLSKAQEEYNTQKAAIDEKLAIASNQIENAKNLYEKIESAKWNVYDRSETPGYNSYESAVNNVKVLSNIFPLMFFIVAALVCFTTMTRMIEEERTQMGTLKALGYSSSSVASKYIIYALFASIIGAAIGIVLGVYLLPYAIYKAYSIMFTMPSIIFAMPLSYILIGTAVSIATTILAALIASIKELRVNPSSLMRPKAPKPGKRVLLEHIKFIWNRISFTGKVTIRNLFRKKSRFIMTVIGIAGCTALILASIGFYSSTNNIMKMQYSDDGIAQYDVQLVFDSEKDEESSIVTQIKNDKRFKDVMLSSMQSVTGGSDDTTKTEDVYLFVPKDSKKLESFVKLQNRETGKKLTLDDSGAIITEQFAKNTNTSIGDKVWIKTADGEKISIPVANITENYTFSYIYLSENLYQYLFQKSVEYKYAIATLDESVLDSSNSNGNESKKAAFTTELMSNREINAVAFVSDTIDSLNEVIGVLSIVVLIFVFAAGVLAYIVLYNLSNINISERHRELATIKVLGFHDKEVSSYIYRESVVLTIIGIGVGLFLGIFLHKLLITYCSVDAVTFVQSLNWYNYLVAGALSAIFAVIVNGIMHKKMRKIDMVTSLKAIE